MSTTLTRPTLNHARSTAGIAALIGADVCISEGGGAKCEDVTGVAALSSAGRNQLSYISHRKHLKAFEATQAGVVVASRGAIDLTANRNQRCVLLLVDDAETAVAKIMGLFATPRSQPACGTHPMSCIAATAEIGDGCALGPFVVVGDRTRVGDRTILHTGVVLGEGVRIGRNCRLEPNVVVGDGVTIGDNVNVHACSVIGSDGFGYRWNGVAHAKVPHLGAVVIEDDVEIGACTCVDRAKFDETRIGRGTKIDNQVQVAHNVKIGPHCVLAGQTGIAGSATLGDGVVIGARGSVLDHVKVGSRSVIAAYSSVFKHTKPGKTVSGTPARPHRLAMREIASTMRLPRLIRTVKKLQEKLDQLAQRVGS